MKLPTANLILTVLCTLCSVLAYTQEQDTVPLQVSSKYFETVSSKAVSLDQKLDKKSQKALTQFAKQEQKLKRKLAKIDSLKAKELFAGFEDKYKSLLTGAGRKSQYIPRLDTLATSLNFLNQNPQLLAGAKDVKGKLDDALSKVNGLKDQFQKAASIKEFLKERRQFLKDQLGKLGFTKELKKLNKQAYYYSQQVNEYKEILKDSKKAERKAIELLSKTKLFKDFMRKNSQLTSLFRLPGSDDDPATQASLAGLQTRAQVNGLIQQQIAAGGPGAADQFRQNLQQAQSQLNELKNKINQYGQSGSDDIMPEGFRVNSEKTRGFLKRLELGTSIQTQRANSIFPVTSDIGLHVGYKLNDKSIIGIGSSLKMGWGTGFRHIRISSQGVGLRSFVDWKVKGSLWISAGYEMNYRSEIRNIAQLRDYSGWQHSGLVGISKVVSMKTKFFKKTKVQLLWDFLSYQQMPMAQPIMFRIGYALR